MKAFDQLTAEQKVDAINMAYYELMNLIRDGVLEIKLIDPASQKRLERILKNEQPRLVMLHLMHDKPIRKEIERLALVAAHGSEYQDNGDAAKELDSETAKHFIGQS